MLIQPLLARKRRLSRCEVYVNFIIGLDCHLASDGLFHPWRMVVAKNSDPFDRLSIVMRLPHSLRYVGMPRHHLYGDLTRIPRNSVEAANDVSRWLLAYNEDEVLANSLHKGGPAEAILSWHGISMTYADVDDRTYGEGDPYGIGGDAGHEITRLIKNGVTA